MGTSDIHRLIDWDFKVAEGGHRPVTLVFAKGRSDTAISEALFARRTVVNYNNLLIGRDEFLVPLISESVSIIGALYKGKTDVLSVEFENKTNLDFLLKNQSGFTFHNNHDLVTLKPGKTTLEVKTLKRLENCQLRFEVLNAVDAPSKHPVVSWNVMVQLK